MGGEGEGSGVRGGGKRGARGREVGVRGEGSGGWGPPCPPPHLSVFHSSSYIRGLNNLLILNLLITDTIKLIKIICKYCFRYRGHCPTTKYDYGETYGNATAKYFQDYRSDVLYASDDPLSRGGEFPTYYTHKPESVISSRGRTRDRWLAAPKYSLGNVDFDRKEELYAFNNVSVSLFILNALITLFGCLNEHIA